MQRTSARMNTAEIDGGFDSDLSNPYYPGNNNRSQKRKRGACPRGGRVPSGWMTTLFGLKALCRPMTSPEINNR